MSRQQERINRIVDCGVNCSDIVDELAGLDRNRIGYIDDVLIAHLECCCEELATGISEIDVVDYRDNGPWNLEQSIPIASATSRVSPR